MAIRGSARTCLVMWTVAAMASLGVFSTEAYAQSRACRSLEAQLASVSRGGNTQANRLDQAIANQSSQLNTVRGRMRQAQCGFGIFGKRGGECSTLRKSSRSMERNLRNLQSQRNRLGGGFNARRERARILAAIDAKGCRRQAPEHQQVRTQKKAEPTKAQREAAARAAAERESKSRQGRLKNAYRTMCVRSCDGYYFPISFSVPRDMFGRDKETCQARCPGAEVELYAYKVLDQQADEMVSVASGNPYRQLETAFLYRRSDKPKSCSCNVQQQNYSVIAGGTEAEKAVLAQQGSAAPEAKDTAFYYVPSPRPDPAADPETSINRAGGLNATTLANLQNMIRHGSDQPRRIRVVGPKFLPGPERAINLQAPAQTIVQ